MASWEQRRASAIRVMKSREEYDHQQLLLLLLELDMPSIYVMLAILAIPNHEFLPSRTVGVAR